MDSKTRLAATRYIWGAFLLALAAVNANIIFYGHSLSDVNFLGTVIVGLAAVLGTGMVWNWGNLDSGAANIHVPASSQKAKRLERIDLVLDLLSEDELDVLRQRLAEANDEQIDLQTLLENDGEVVRRSR